MLIIMTCYVQKTDIWNAWMRFYILIVFHALRHGIFRSAVHLQVKTFPTTAPVRRHATIMLSVTSNDIPGKFFLLQFRCRVWYTDRQSLAIKAVRVRSLIVLNYMGRRKMRGIYMKALCHLRCTLSDQIFKKIHLFFYRS